LLTPRLNEGQLNVILMRSRFGRLLSRPKTAKGVSDVSLSCRHPAKAGC